MREPIIQYGNPKLKYDIYGTDNLTYKGEPFTGTILGDEMSLISYTEFTAGYFDGDSVSYHGDGQIAEKSFYKNGECLSTTEWYENGQLKSDENHLYNIDGQLLKINGSWLYPNGTKRNEQGNGENYLFSSKGELAIKTIINMTGDYKNTNIYYDNVLSNCYEEILTNFHADFDSLFYNTEYYIWGWVVKKYSIDNGKGAELLNTLAEHCNQNIAQTAKSLIKSFEENKIIPENYVNGIGYHTILE